MRDTASVSALPSEPLSVEEYLAWARDQEEPYEFVDGHIVLLSNGSARHDLLADGLVALLTAALADGPSRVSGMRRSLRVGDQVRRPDVLVVCSPPTDDLVEVDAHYLVEVLSPGTSKTDISEKRVEYTSLPSSRQYLVLDPDVRFGLLWTRHEPGWHLGEAPMPVLEFAGVQLDLGPLYDRLDAKAGPPHRGT